MRPAADDGKNEVEARHTDELAEVKTAIRRQFRIRAQSYDKYTVWVEDKRLLAEILRPLQRLRRDAICLDLGGGTGVVASRGSSIAGIWTVVDLSFHMMTAGVHPRLLVGDAERIPIRSHSVDFVVARSLLGYVNAERVLAEIRRLLSPDGVVVVAERVLGDYAGAAAKWYWEVHRLRNPLKRDAMETRELASTIRATGFDLLSSVELRRDFCHEIDEWLSRSGSIPESSQRRLLELVKDPPPEVKMLGFSASGGYVCGPISWAVHCAQQASSRLRPSLVVSIIPVRIHREKMEIFVQQRLAPAYKEPEFLGQFEFPQGHVEDGESIGDAVRRELAEEAGLTVRRVVVPATFSIVQSFDGVATEESSPASVVRTSGQLNYLSLVFVVEVEEHTPLGAVDNRGRWISEREIGSFVEKETIYPLNRPMFDLVLAQLADLKRNLKDRL